MIKNEKIWQILKKIWKMKEIIKNFVFVSEVLMLRWRWNILN